MLGESSIDVQPSDMSDSNMDGPDRPESPSDGFICSMISIKKEEVDSDEQEPTSDDGSQTVPTIRVEHPMKDIKLEPEDETIKNEAEAEEVEKDPLQADAQDATAGNRRFYKQQDFVRALQDIDEEELAGGSGDEESLVGFCSGSEGEPEEIFDDVGDSFSEQDEDDQINADYRAALEYFGPQPNLFNEPMVTDDFDVYFGQDGLTYWLSKPIGHPTPKCPNIMKTVPGPTSVSTGVKSELEIFLLFLTIDMIDRIVEYTNNFIAERRNKSQTSMKRKREGELRMRDFKDTSRNELMALMGLLYILSTRKSNRLKAKSAWKDDGTGMMICRANFSYNRFVLLLGALRFGDRRDRGATVDKLAAIREICSLFNKNCQRNYRLSKYVTIDEIFHPFRGRCSVNMPMNAAKSGVKMYALFDARTCYMHNFEVYWGKQNERPFKTSNKPINVVKRLVELIKDTNRNLTIDSHYTSIPLAEFLLKNGTTMIGKLKNNDVEIPPEFLPNAKRTICSSIFGFQDNKAIVSYVPKKGEASILISTLHNDEQRDEKTGKPQILIDYNSTKADRVRQRFSLYSTTRRTNRCLLAIFFRILDITCVNAHVLFVANNLKDVNEERLRRRFFTDQLAFELMNNHLVERAKMKFLPRDISVFLSKKRKDCPGGPAVSFEHLPLRGPCFECGKHKNNKTTVRCSECFNFACRKHTVVRCVACASSNVDGYED